MPASLERVSCVKPASSLARLRFSANIRRLETFVSDFLGGIAEEVAVNMRQRLAQVNYENKPKYVSCTIIFI